MGEWGERAGCCSGPQPRPGLAALGAGGWAEAGREPWTRVRKPWHTTLGEDFMALSLSFPTYEVTFTCTPVSGPHLGQGQWSSKSFADRTLSEPLPQVRSVRARPGDHGLHVTLEGTEAQREEATWPTWGKGLVALGMLPQAWHRPPTSGSRGAGSGDPPALPGLMHLWPLQWMARQGLGVLDVARAARSQGRGGRLGEPSAGHHRG